MVPSSRPRCLFSSSMLVSAGHLVTVSLLVNSSPQWRHSKFQKAGICLGRQGTGQSGAGPLHPSPGYQLPGRSPPWASWAPEPPVCRTVRGTVLDTGLLNDQLHQLAPVTCHTLSTGNGRIQGGQPLPGTLSPDEDHNQAPGISRAPALCRAPPAQGKALLHSLTGLGGGKMADTATWEEEERGGVASRAPARQEQAPAGCSPARRRPRSPAPGRVRCLFLFLSLKNKTVFSLNLQVTHVHCLKVWKIHNHQKN